MLDHRDELLVRAQTLVAGLPRADASENQAAVFARYFDQVVSAIGRESGIPSDSPLPQGSAAAADLGAQHHRAGLEARDIPKVFGALSVSIGALGAEHGLQFDASEYRVFNECTDEAIAEAVERVWEGARLEHEYQTAVFVGNLAHELRNELWSARLSFDHLRETVIPEKSRTGAVLGRCLARMEELVSQSMVLAQLESGTPLALHTVSVATLLSELERAAFPPRGITLHVESDSPMEVIADERLMSSAFSNLIRNALKFTRSQGHVFVRARLELSELVVEVEDECGGLPAGKAEELFQPFEQRSANRSGLGLGLSISRAAAAAHGGTIDVRNLPGKGCVFTLRQPVQPATEPHR